MCLTGRRPRPPDGSGRTQRKSSSLSASLGAAHQPDRVAKATIKTPLGLLDVYVRGRRIVAVEFRGRDRALQALGRHLPHLVVEEAPDPAEILRPFARYFDGDVHALSAVDIAPHGTLFQQRVWALLRTVPPGATISYGRLAERLKQPKATRAVGLANGANPIPIIIPCHRVVGSDGSLTGYGSGLDRKSWLLQHEGAAVGLRT